MQKTAIAHHAYKKEREGMGDAKQCVTCTGTSKLENTR